MAKKHWKISIPRFDLYCYNYAFSSRQAVLFALKRMQRERPWMKGAVRYTTYLDNSEEYCERVEEVK